MTIDGGGAPDQPPDISVVVPVYNEARRLRACLEALLHQRYPERAYEIVVVDNASTDASADIATSYPRVQLLRELRPGAYVARNRGVAASRGTVIAFIDPDCMAADNWLATIAAAMSDPGVGVVQGLRRAGVDRAAVTALADYDNAKAAYVFGGGPAELYYGYANNMAVRRELFSAVGPFVDVPRGADTIFVRRVVKARSAAAVRYRPDMIVTHAELDSVGSYFRKVFLYGHHRRKTEPIETVRPMGMKERIAAYRRAVRDGNYSLPKAALLAVLLTGGLFSWRLGTAVRWKVRDRR